ncbi:MAG: membrane protein insertase YidC [Saprospiraceae bacterium]|nr:membrane protein insertase YidC [Saprospiraceae bacterium]
MDRNTIIGFTLIFALLLVWQQFVAPSAEELAAQQQLQDSLAATQVLPEETIATAVLPGDLTAVEALGSDSATLAALEPVFGTFASAALGTDEKVVLENNLMRVTLASKGGRIVEVLLKNHQKMLVDSAGNESKIPLLLLEDPKNVFDYLIPMNGVANGGIHTQSLFFTVNQTSDKAVRFVATGSNGATIEQTYQLSPDNYTLDYALNTVGLDGNKELTLNWINYLDKLEVNNKVEKTYGTAFYKLAEEGVDNLSKTSSDEVNFEAPIQWVSHSNQFFNSTLFAKSNFPAGESNVEVFSDDDVDLKKCATTLNVPSNANYEMQWYIGPNEFSRMQAIGSNFSDVVPFGSSILGTINRWVIRPVFTFLSGLIGSMGVVILMLTFIVKMVLYPLTYRMLYSQSKMAALKPQIEHMKVKFKDDQQQQQVETMKLYREFGVNPLGGCLPMLLQMPIWIALYRFFPAAIEFRQASFLWATDLSSYDVFMRLPFEIPLGFGSHISLFTVLWALTTLIYTYYNTKDMDMSANPAMKYMQYIMPIFFLGFFNSYASGLTCYLLFSNVINIGQTIVTKSFVINHDKIREELDAYKKKPKKKGGFQERLESALKEQQRIAAEREATKRKK